MGKKKGNNHFNITGGSRTNGEQYTPPPNKTTMFFDYPNTTFSADEIIKKNFNDGGDTNKKHIVAQYNNPNSTPNFIMSNTNNYKATKIYITKLIHNVIPDLTEESNALEKNGKPVIIGEMVVEHEPMSGGSQKLYSCFFLKEDTTGKINNIDALIDMSSESENGTSNELHIGKNIPQNNDSTKSSSVSYNSNNNKVFVNFTPASISTDSANIVKDLTYDMSDHFLGTSEDISKDAEITNNYIVHGMATVVNSAGAADENMPNLGPNSDYYLDCNPSGESKDTIASYNVPINSEYTKGAAATEASQTMMNFIIFTAIIAMVYMVIPTLYQNIVYTKYAIPAKSNLKILQLGAGIRNFDTTLIIFLICFFLLLSSAFEKYNTALLIYGLFFIGLSAAAVTTSKSNNGDFINVIDYADNQLSKLRTNYLPLDPFGSFLPFFFQTLFYPLAGPNQVKAALIVIYALYILFIFDPANVITTKDEKKEGKGGSKFFTEKPYEFMFYSALIYGGVGMFGYMALGSKINPASISPSST